MRLFYFIFLFFFFNDTATTEIYTIVGLIKPNEGRIFLENDEKEVSELTSLPVYRRAQLGVGCDIISKVEREGITVSSTAIRNLIREQKTHQIDSVIASSAGAGMRTMDQSLFSLVKEGKISKETALQCSIHQEALAKRFQAEGLDVTVTRVEHRRVLEIQVRVIEEET